MNIQIRKAISHFFPSPSFPQVYSEAVANAIDAKADYIEIDIKIKSYNDPESLNLRISDNGEGFTDESFNRFSSLLDAKDKKHKGLGRLLFLEYFKGVSIRSVFSMGKGRKFLFDEKFKGKFSLYDVPSSEHSGTILEFGKCVSSRFNSYDDLRPSTIKQQLLAEFQPVLLERKNQGVSVKIDIKIEVSEPNPEKNFTSDKQSLTQEDLPVFEAHEFDVEGLDLYSRSCRLLYSVGEVEHRFHYVSTAVVVDGRSIEFPLLKNDSIPSNAMAIFLLESEFLNSCTDDARKELKLKAEQRLALEIAYRNEVARILEQKLPGIIERNKKTATILEQNYPHLKGLFDEKTVGIVDYDKSVRYAQERFFNEQKAILEAKELSNEQYERAMNHAARVLAEYILYREKMIDKIEAMTSADLESEIHNIILPKGSVVRGNDLFVDRYTNNAWMLDDKYMSYQCILSDENIKELIDEVSTSEEKSAADLRPDLALVFAADISSERQKSDVVVVEMKRRETAHLKTMEAIAQLRQRARRLLAYYPEKIQRMWFFGIVDFDKESELEMRDNWTPVYSADKAYYRTEMMTPCDADLNPIGETKYPVALTVMSFNAFLKDARLRNHAFLQILKGGIKECMNV
jgi:hypothetical protein